MSRPDYVSDLKLCIEILSRFEINPDLTQLEFFLADETQLELLNQCAMRIKQAWENARVSSSNLVNLEKHPIVDIPDLPGFKNLKGLTENPPELETVKPVQISPQKPLVRFKLPNATVGKPYQELLEWVSAKKINILGISGLDGLGLSYDLALNTLSGEPEKAGEHDLIISYQQSDDPAQATQNTEFSLVINSNPKSLWKNIASDPTTVFWKADCDFQGKTGLYGWKLAAASKRGRSHAHVGSCRDDDFALHVDNDNHWHIMAVTDGAGSSEYSREGARIIAHNSVAILTAQLQQMNATLNPLIENWQLDNNLSTEIDLEQALADVFSVAIRSSIEKIDTLAKQQQVAYRDFYSTLLIAAHKSFPNGEFIVSYWVGDGGLGLYSVAQQIDLLGESDSGEYAGQTRFLDKISLEREDLLKRLQFRSQKSFTALVLMTDGITDPFFETDNNLKALNHWNALWQQIQPQLSDDPELSAQLLTEWLDFWSPGNHDDRTIALIYR